MPIARIILAITLLLAGGLVLAGWMGISAIARANQDTATGAIAVVLEDLAHTLESGARLGITPAAQTATGAQIADARASLPMLVHVAVLDARGGRLFVAPPDSALPDIALPAHLTRIERPVLDDLGAPIATIVAIHDGSGGQRQMVTLAGALIAGGLPVAAILVLAGGIVVQSSLRRLQRLAQAPDTALAASGALASFDAALDRIATSADSRECR